MRYHDLILGHLSHMDINDGLICVDKKEIHEKRNTRGKLRKVHSALSQGF